VAADYASALRAASRTLSIVVENGPPDGPFPAFEGERQMV